MWYKRTFDRFLPDPGDAHATAADLATAAANPIDFVIAWSGPGDSSSKRERDNGELTTTMRAQGIGHSRF